MKFSRQVEFSLICSCNFCCFLISHRFHRLHRFFILAYYAFLPHNIYGASPSSLAKI